MLTPPVINGVHHINFLVKDLECALRQWRALGVQEVIQDELPGRGVKTARFQLGTVWMVLVQPVAEGEPMEVLRTQGEGLFLVSLQVDELTEAVSQTLNNGGRFTADKPRQGLSDWQVIDVDPDVLSGARVQLMAHAPLVGRGFSAPDGKSTDQSDA